MPALGLFLAVTLALAQTAQAGFFSFVAKFLGYGGGDEAPYNSQNIPLLKAPAAADPKAATGGADIATVGDTSLLPVVGPMGSIADVDTYKLDQITTYTVRAGDTLSSIADMFGISVNTIYWANNLKQGDKLNIGDTLVILPISGIQYTAKKGDTAQSLAKKFKSDAEDIIAYNNLPGSGLLAAGETIIIPDAEMGAAPGVKVWHSARLRGAGGPDLEGYYMRPIFGGYESQGLHGFNAVDLANFCGTPIYAAADGTIIVARSQGWNGGYGRYVVIAHPNGTQTLYAHMSQVFADVGENVTQGKNIGLIGTTGNSTGCHVHFEIRGAKNPF